MKNIIFYSLTIFVTAFTATNAQAQEQASICSLLPKAEVTSQQTVAPVVAYNDYASTGQRVKVKTADGQVVEGKIVSGGMLSSSNAHVGADYQAGVDAYGNPVAPVNMSNYETPAARAIKNKADKVRVPLEMDLAQRLLSLDGSGIILSAPLGMIDIYKDGRVAYNGQDWTDPVYSLCGRPQRVVTSQTVMDVKPMVDSFPAPDAMHSPPPQEVMVKQELAVMQAKEVPSVQAKIPGTVTTKVITDKPELLQGGEYR